ncbi:hypothetical protein [Ramlibacter sp. 2FC]|uniref:hypothetical protein n=1 Tax=Ramlibacter sp. 2FC TaxID=2502188 RepID=UPI0010F5AAEA|nr:hypothetical protein [Ramlibacter sp. 2FC]
MNRLQSELHRLYLSQDPERQDHVPQESDLIAPDGRVRALVLELARPADWHALSAAWQGVQAELELPAPAIAVSGVDGCQLWFSLAQPVPVAQALGFLESLRLRYLGNVKAGRVGLMAAGDAAMVPALQEATGRWSAFVAPDLAALFADEPWLDLAPSPEAQADLLSRLQSIPPADFERALERLGAGAHPPAAPAEPAHAASAPAGEPLDPKRFLLGVMNDAAVALPLRIEAAKALLPYFEAPRDR